jgi:hypothetical protein
VRSSGSASWSGFPSSGRCPISAGGEHGAGGEVGAEANDLPGPGAGGAEDFRNGFLQGGDVVGGMLKCRVERETFLVAGERFFDHAVGILMNCGGDFGAGLDIDQERAGGQGSEINTENITTGCPPRRRRGFHAGRVLQKRSAGQGERELGSSGQGLHAVYPRRRYVWESEGMKTNSCRHRIHGLVPAGCGALALAVVVMVARPASGCGDYASLEVFRWVAEAVSTNDVVADRAIKRLRERGPAGLDALLRTHAQTLQRQELPLLTRFAGAEDTELSRLNRALDRVGGQRDCAVSRLYWHTDIEAAKSAAKASGRPILSLRLLGRLDEELSCANSRFFRTALYANAEISAYLREHFVLHWKSVRPVPRMTIDFGDGRKLERTVTGNSIHYICDAEGRPIDALPGLYGPKAFLPAAGVPRCLGEPQGDRAVCPDRA